MSDGTNISQQGKTKMQPINTNLSKPDLKKQCQNSRTQQINEKLKTDDGKDFAAIYAKAFLTQKVYGDQVENLTIKVKAFLSAVIDLDLKQVNHAFTNYLLNNHDLPTPCAIRESIKLKPKYSQSMGSKFIEIKTKIRFNPSEVTETEWKIAEDFKQQREEIEMKRKLDSIK